MVRRSHRKGEEGTSGIYVKILSKLGVRKNKKTDNVLTLDDIREEIKRIEKRAELYIQMGFISKTDYNDVSDRLSTVLKKNYEAAANILMSYLETQKNRLDALDHLVETIAYLMSSLNDYLFKKRVAYSVRQGFKFYQMDGVALGDRQEIPITKLSSGERQLLRLFSMVIRNSDACPIIIIDEPEISLNIKWQRRLLTTLSYFVRGTRAQFVIATHSFEILSSHADNTAKLGNPYTPKVDD